MKYDRDLMLGFTPEGQDFFFLPDLISHNSKNVKNQELFRTWTRTLSDDSKEWVIDLMSETMMHKNKILEPQPFSIKSLFASLKERFI